MNMSIQNGLHIPTCVFKHFVGNNNPGQVALTAVVIHIKADFNIS